jgi:hypothetical protein
MMDGPPFMCSNCKNQSHQFHEGNQREHLLKIDSLLLHIAFCDELGFMLDGTPMLIPLCLVNPFEANGSYPTMIILVLLSSSLLRCVLVFLTCTIQPNVHRCATLSFVPCQDSYGVIPTTLRVGDLFNKYTAVVTASPLKNPGRFFAFIMLHAVATTD